MKLTRRNFNIGLGALSAAIGIFPGVTFANTTPKAGGTLNVSVNNEPPILIEILQNTSTSGVGSRVIEGLVKVNFDQTISPYLAKSWEVSEDGRTFTFDLQEGVLWHDGTPFTSEDVAFSLFTLRETHPRRRSTFAGLESADTSDPHRIVLQFSDPVPYLLPALTATGSPIIPKHLYEGTDPRTNPYNSKPIGTGPYVFAEWERGSHHILERNPNYWVEGLPLLDRIITRFIPEASSRVAAFEAGDTDIGFASQLPLDEIPRFESDPRFEITTRGYEQGGLLNQLFFNLRTEQLSKLPVREAIAHAINVPDYIERVFRGYAVPVASAITPALSHFHDDTIKHRTFDPERANALLDEAGYPRGADGTRFALRLTHNPSGASGGGTMRAAAEYIRSALADIGIRVDIQSYDFATYVTRVYTDYAFDLDVQHLVNGYDPTDGIQRAYWSKNIQEGLAWANHSNYANAEVDEAFEKGAIEPDQALRREHYVRLQHVLDRDLPAINLASYQSLTVARTYVRDHTVDASGGTTSFATTWKDV